MDWLGRRVRVLVPTRWGDAARSCDQSARRHIRYDRLVCMARLGHGCGSQDLQGRPDMEWARGRWIEGHKLVCRLAAAPNAKAVFGIITKKEPRQDPEPPAAG